MSTVQKKPVALVVGASRGIGRQIAIDLARNGYAGESTAASTRNQRRPHQADHPPEPVVVAAKSISDPSAPLPDKAPGPNSPESTITTVAREIHRAGGEAIAVRVDVRFAESVDLLVTKVVAVSGPKNPWEDDGPWRMSSPLPGIWSPRRPRLQ
jgi:NAD(P)-dependent dehydrogenase (short-subunit alcohol dehydrogenase family)